MCCCALAPSLFLLVEVEEIYICLCVFFLFICLSSIEYTKTRRASFGVLHTGQIQNQPLFIFGSIHKCSLKTIICESHHTEYILYLLECVRVYVAIFSCDSYCVKLILFIFKYIQNKFNIH